MRARHRDDRVGGTPDLGLVQLVREPVADQPAPDRVLRPIRGELTREAREVLDQLRRARRARRRGRFERGELPNRDVVEANQSLLDAQNALIDEQVSYEIARLQLLRDLGILFVGEDGMWKR